MPLAIISTTSQDPDRAWDIRLVDDREVTLENIGTEIVDTLELPQFVTTETIDDEGFIETFTRIAGAPRGMWYSSEIDAIIVFYAAVKYENRTSGPFVFSYDPEFPDFSHGGFYAVKLQRTAEDYIRFTGEIVKIGAHSSAFHSSGSPTSFQSDIWGDNLTALSGATGRSIVETGGHE